MSRCDCCGTKDECGCYPYGSEHFTPDWWTSARTVEEGRANEARRRAALALWGWAGEEREAVRREDEARTQLPFSHADRSVCPTFYDGCHCSVETLRYNIDRAEKAESRLAALEAACRAKDEALNAAHPFVAIVNQNASNPTLRAEAEVWIRRLDSALAAGDYERAGHGEAGKDVLSDLASALDAIAAPATVMDGATPEAIGRARAVAAVRRWIEDRRTGTKTGGTTT